MAPFASSSSQGHQTYHSTSLTHSNGQHDQLQPATTTQPTGPKRKGSLEIDTSDHTSDHTSDQAVQRRQRQDEHPEDSPANLDVDKESVSDDSNSPVSYWAKHQNWPLDFLELKGDMGYLLARKRSTRTLRQKSSASSISPGNTTLTPSDQNPRESKSAQYRDPRHTTLLATLGSFVDEDDVGIG